MLATVACRLAGVHLNISCASVLPWSHELDVITGARTVVEDEVSLIARLYEMSGGTMRIWGDYDVARFAPSEIGNIPIVRPQVIANGRVEFLNYVREQSMTQIVHRYGNII